MTKEVLYSGVFAIIAAIAAAIVPFLWPSTLSNSDGVLLVNQIDTRVSQSLVIDDLKNLNLEHNNKRMTIVKFENVGATEIKNFAIEIRANVPWSDLQFGSILSDNFFSSDQSLAPYGESSLIIKYNRFPAEGSQDVFILSDNDFHIKSITSNVSDVKIAYADKYLWNDVSEISLKNKISGALWLLSIAAVLLTILRLFKFTFTFTFQFRRLP